MSPSQDSEFPEPDSMTVDPAHPGSVDPYSVEGIFFVSLRKSGTEREAFLSLQCADASQRQRVEALLQAYEQAGNFLQKPAVAVEVTPIANIWISVLCWARWASLALMRFLKRSAAAAWGSFFGLVIRSYSESLL